VSAPVLVARLDNCGDVLLTGPAVRAVARSDRPVVFLCGPRGRPAAELLPEVDDILEFRAPWIEPDPMPVRRQDADRLVARIARSGATDALVLGSSHQSPLPLAVLLRWAGLERIAAVSHEHAGSLLDMRVPGDPDQHEVERNLSVAAALGFPRPDDDRLAVRLDLGFGDAGTSAHSDIADPGGPTGSREPTAQGPYVVVHPGASAPARTLAPARWSEIVTYLVRRGRRVVLTGSEEERGLTAAIGGRHRDVRDLAGQMDFGQLAGVLADAAAVVCGNTGPMHLAAAVGTPVVAVFAPTVPLDRWRPWRVEHVVLGDQTVACSGCRSRVCPLPRQICVDGVSPPAVDAALDGVTRTATR
jgi:ADP-heptose:LPS heptosyltransferase